MLTGVKALCMGAIVPRQNQRDTPEGNWNLIEDRHPQHGRDHGLGHGAIYGNNVCELFHPSVCTCNVSV